VNKAELTDRSCAREETDEDDDKAGEAGFIFQAWGVLASPDRSA